MLLLYVFAAVCGAGIEALAIWPINPSIALLSAPFGASIGGLLCAAVMSLQQTAGDGLSKPLPETPAPPALTRS